MSAPYTLMGSFEHVILDTGSITNPYEKNYIHIMDDKSRIAEIRVNVGAAFPGDIADSIVYTLEDQIGSSTIRLDDHGPSLIKRNTILLEILL